MLNANTYVTKEEGIGGTIRNRWEDFYVEEIPEVIPDGEGPNIYIWIEKLGRTTLDVLLDIARDLHIDRKRMGFAGMKDKKAITRQWICIANMDSEEQFKQVEALSGTIHNTEFLKVVRGRKKLRMGQLVGNKFRILVKDIDGMDSEDEEERKSAIEDAAKRADAILKTLEKTGVPNYFGWQRFGKPRTNTHLVGEALIQNDLKEAVRRYIGNPCEEESEDSQKARQAYDETRNKLGANASDAVGTARKKIKNLTDAAQEHGNKTLSELRKAAGNARSKAEEATGNARDKATEAAGRVRKAAEDKSGVTDQKNREEARRRAMMGLDDAVGDYSDSDNRYQKSAKGKADKAVDSAKKTADRV